MSLHPMLAHDRLSRRLPVSRLLLPLTILESKESRPLPREGARPPPPFAVETFVFELVVELAVAVALMPVEAEVLVEDAEPPARDKSK